MTRRFRAREVALQLLFQFDLNPSVPRTIIESFARERVPDAALLPFCLGLFDGAVAQRGEIDAALSAAAANWRLVRMAAVDRNVLRLGAYEILYAKDGTPAPVALDEAIELARRFGSKDSPAFVNGVLDNINQLRTAELGLPISNADSDTPDRSSNQFPN
jgi:transcription antitermination protein NusB